MFAPAVLRSAQQISPIELIRPISPICPHGGVLRAAPGAREPDNQLGAGRRALPFHIARHACHHAPPLLLLGHQCTQLNRPQPSNSANLPQLEAHQHPIYRLQANKKPEGSGLRALDEAVWHSNTRCGFAYKATPRMPPSSIRTLPSAPESHRICNHAPKCASLAGSAQRPYRRSGISPCPEGFPHRVHERARPCKTLHIDADPVVDLRHRQGPAHVVALRGITIELRQALQGRRLLHAFGQNRVPEIMPQVDD